MNGFSAADMSTAAANGFRDGLAAQSAAAQEAVVWQWRCPRGDAEWSECTKDIYDNLRNAIGGDSGYMKGLHYEVRALYAAPVAAAPVDLDAHGLRALDLCVRDLRRLIELSDDFALDEMQIQSLLTAIESMELRKVASTPAEPGIDLGKLQRYRMASGPIRGRNLYKDDTGTWVKIQDVERALIDASQPSVAKKNPLPCSWCEEGQIECSMCKDGSHD